MEVNGNRNHLFTSILSIFIFIKKKSHTVKKTWGYEDRVNDDNIFIFRLDYPFRIFEFSFQKFLAKSSNLSIQQFSVSPFNNVHTAHVHKTGVFL